MGVDARRGFGRMRASAASLLLALAAAAFLSGCSDGGKPFRIGVVVDCVGANRPLHDPELSGAELPLIERGATLRGKLAEDGVTAADVAGRQVEIVPGCTELWEFSTLTTEVRRLVEDEHVDAIVAGGTGPDEVVLREVARRYPKVVFIPVVHGPREVTLQNPVPNLFRVVGDHGQGVAGLGTYAYRHLGWRRAAVVLFNWDLGWGSRDAFVAEFCSLGGTIAKQISSSSFDPTGADVAKVPRGVDGVAVFIPGFFDPVGFLNRLAKRFRDPARHIVVGPSVTNDPALLRSTRRALAGVTGSSFVDPARMRSFLRSYARAFPGTPTDLAGNELVTGYRDAVAALLAALEKAGGSSARLPAELARLRIGLLGGPVRLDRNGQAVISTTLVRIKPPGAPDAGLAPVRTIRGVNQTIGGLVPPGMIPTDSPAKCRAGRRPPWAR
jgi:branched-chain amino acid transport system substrate-binding protein